MTLMGVHWGKGGYGGKPLRKGGFGGKPWFSSESFTGLRAAEWQPEPEASAALTLRLHLIAQPVDGGLRAALAVRDAERAQRHFDHAERAEDHRRIDVAHVRDTEGLAGEIADAVPQRHAAVLVTVGAEPLRVVAVHQHGRNGVAALTGLGN